MHSKHPININFDVPMTDMLSTLQAESRGNCCILERPLIQAAVSSSAQQQVINECGCEAQDGSGDSVLSMIAIASWPQATHLTSAKQKNGSRSAAPKFRTIHILPADPARSQFHIPVHSFDTFFWVIFKSTSTGSLSMNNDI